MEKDVALIERSEKASKIRKSALAACEKTLPNVGHEFKMEFWWGHLECVHPSNSPTKYWVAYVYAFAGFVYVGEHREFWYDKWQLLLFLLEDKTENPKP